MSQELFIEYIKMGVENNQISQFLSKYRTIDSTKKILDNNSLWFSSPSEFNDPFDCQIITNTNNTLEEIEFFLRSNSEVPLSERKIKDLAKDAFETPGKWKNIIDQTFDTIINKTGVCCFTKDEKNLLMWSHYTDSHKGICLKFDILKDPAFFIYPLPVNYRNDYPNYNHLGDRTNMVNDIVLSKSNDWSYEQEIRVIKPQENGLIEFDKKALVEIIFGCKTSIKDRDDIISLSRKNGFNIKFKQAKKKDKEFALEVVDL